MKHDSKIIFLTLLLIFALNLENSFSLETYVGIKINNLTDDPAYSCSGVSGYGSQGRIRAISSYPSYGYPLYFNVTKISDGSILWTGNSTDETDYTTGDTIYLPQTINLTSGEDYKIMMDIDLIKIYVPLQSHAGFVPTTNNTYWVNGKIGTSSNSEYRFYSNANVCTGNLYSSVSTTSLYALYPYLYSINSSCLDDSTSLNCDDEGIATFYAGAQNQYNYKAYSAYDNLHMPDTGNFYFQFTY